MKRILVVDESRAVRETLGLVLGSDYAIVERPYLSNEDVLSEGEKMDLLILGMSARSASDAPALSRIASQLPFPVLFLVDSKSTLGFMEEQGKIHFLAKPFNPYSLKEKVAQLLVQGDRYPNRSFSPAAKTHEVTRYLEFPRIPAFTSTLAKRYALTSLPILILGEAGCGEERVARALHGLKHQAGSWNAAHISEASQDHLLEQLGRISRREDQSPQRVTLFLSGVEALQPLNQSALLDFLDREEEIGSHLWLLSSSRVDLLEKVYRGEFLDPLYYRLATLTLRLPPLRERQNDIPSLAALLAHECGESLGLGKVSFSPDALDRLCNYLWFGNLSEMETVVGRTLAAHRKNRIQASDLIFDVPEEGRHPPLASAAQDEPAYSYHMERKEEEAPTGPEPEAKELAGPTRSNNGDFREISVFVNELAHELKNPMVTIKTFAQLLGDRFDDEAFRARFRETVGGDIERMDELLEVLLDFSRFSHPATERIRLFRSLSGALDEILPECVKKEATLRWVRKGEKAEVCVDEAQLRYAFKNIVQAALTQVAPKGAIELDVEGEGRITVGYIREADQISSFTHYLDLSSAAREEEALPLRILLAKILLERNGGKIKIDHFDEGKVLIRTELPVP